MADFKALSHHYEFLTAHAERAIGSLDLDVTLAL